MLVPFAIDADSLRPDQSWSPTQQKTYHKNLLDVWRQIGLLVYDGCKFDESRLKQTVLQLPQSLRTLWLEVFEHAHSTAAGTQWNGTISLATIQHLSAARLVIVDDTCAEVEFNFSEDCTEISYPLADGHTIDVCRFIAANHAHAFSTAFDQSGTHIEAGAEYKTTWNSRFKTLASVPTIKKVVIVDRYAIARHHEPNSQSGLSGLERFLRLLDAEASGPRYVTLYSARTDRLNGKSINDIRDELEAVIERLSYKHIKQLKAIIVPESDGFRDYGHDRFIRFDNYVWDIGLGLEIFEGAFCPRWSSATFKSGAAVDSYREVEKKLFNNDKTQSTVIEL